MVHKKRVVFVAAYSPEENLAGAKKIETIIQLFTESGKRVLLVNTSHINSKFARTKITKSKVGDAKVVEITPFTTPYRRLGKAINPIFCFFTRITSRCFKSSIVWLYNGYWFENVFALANKNNASLVYEIEDLPFSRDRGGLNLKDMLDGLSFKFAMKKASAFTFVNAEIQGRLCVADDKAKFILPTLLNDRITQVNIQTPFQNSNSIRVGYFGGLDAEKGGTALLELIENMPEGCRLTISGKGSMADKIYNAAKQHPDVRYLGLIDEETLYREMNESDVLLNPHKPIKSSNNGIFPFKVCEYLYLRKLVISTELPVINELVSNTVEIYSGDNKELSKLILKSKDIYLSKQQLIKEASQYIEINYSRSALRDFIVEKI
ncbi:hypothetical protein NBRC116592_33110 [Colwellia sp. KU-HH00111]|uniref:glycosyltransferase n=1 Tax=Colwellia sp. KU-HH00111 TaxID=3127652 RepID=UPI003103F3F9